MTRDSISILFLSTAVALSIIAGCGDTPDLELRDGLRVQLAEEQAALARYEAEHREWATETIAKMKKLVETLPAETAEFAKSKSKQEVDAFIAERKLELEVLTQEMEARLDVIKKKAAEVEETKKQLGEAESKLGIKPTAPD